MNNKWRSWLVLTTMTLCIAIIVAPAWVLGGVFLLPLLKAFGRSRATMALVVSIGVLLSSILAPAAGFLLDRIEARWVVATGALLACCGMLLASQAHSLVLLVPGFCLFGAGVAAAGLVPAATVVSNWFERRRGLALAIAMTGFPLGGAVLTPLTTYVIAHADWRWAYITLASLMLLLIPIILVTVRSRPDFFTEADHRTVSELPGLEVREALSAREFWLLSYTFLAFTLGAAALNTHAIPYFIGMGTAPAKAALLISAALTVDAVTKPLAGAFADYFGVRRVLALVMAMLAIGAFSLLRAKVSLFMVLFVVDFGVGVGAPMPLIPMLGAEAFGLRRFGTLWGAIGWSSVVAWFAGSFGAGYIYDLAGSYAPVFVILGTLASCAALAPFACRGFSPAAQKTGAAALS